MTKNEKNKEEMLDIICGPDTNPRDMLADEIEFMIYGLQSELNRLQKLVFKYRRNEE